MSTILIGRVFGIEIRINRSWVFVVLLVALAVAMQFEQLYPDWSPAIFAVAGLATSAILVMSVVAHELAHCLAARRYGIEARSISLNFFGGMSRLGRPPVRPGEEFVYSIAGPAANLVLGALFFVVSELAANSWVVVAAIAMRAGALNLILGVFNLIPGLPLDGGRMLRSVVWWMTGSYERGTTAASFVGQVLAILLVMSGIAVTLDGDVGGLFVAALGYYLFVRARAGMAEVALRRALNGVTVRSLWLETLPQVARDVTVGEFIRNLSTDEVSADPHFMVVDDGVIWGLMPASAALAADVRAWETLTVGDVMTPIDRIEKLSYQTEVLRAMEAIYASNVSELPVIDDNVVQGFVGREALLRFVASRLALNGGQTT